MQHCSKGMAIITTKCVDLAPQQCSHQCSDCSMQHGSKELPSVSDRSLDVEMVSCEACNSGAPQTRLVEVVEEVELGLV